MARKNREKPDIISVANLAGVSPATVSRAINHPQMVKADTRRRIEKAVAECGYIRNRAAQAMHGKRSATVGLIVPTISNAIFAELIQSFSEAMGDRGFTILIAPHGFDLKREYAVLRKLLEHRIDGIALIGLDHLKETYNLIAEQSVPAVAVWNYRLDAPISCVGADNSDAGRRAASHLLELGHTRIGLVFPMVKENDRARARLSGALETMAERGIEPPTNWRAHAPYDLATAKEVCAAMLSDKNRPTALLCGNDVIARGAVFAAQRLGLRIPQDLSVIGIGDFEGSAEMEPALTSIRIPARRIGAHAGEVMADAIANEADEAKVLVEFSVALHERDTTGPAPEKD